MQEISSSWWYGPQLFVDIDDPDGGIVAKVARIGDEGIAEHRIRALDGGRIAAPCIGEHALQTAQIVPLRVEVIGLGRRQQLHQPSYTLTQQVILLERHLRRKYSTPQIRSAK